MIVVPLGSRGSQAAADKWRPTVSGNTPRAAPLPDREKRAPQGPLSVSRLDLGALRAPPSPQHCASSREGKARARQ